MFTKLNFEFLVTRAVLEMERVTKIFLFSIALTVFIEKHLLRPHYVQSCLPGVLGE